MEIKTKRLFIRNLYEADWMEMQKIFLDFHHSKYAVYDRPVPTGEIEVKAAAKKFADSSLFFAIYLLEKNEMAGYVCFHKNGSTFDLGYCFHSSYHFNGYAYESINALIEYFVREYGITHFTAGTALDNKPSCKLLEKLGFICVSTEKVSFDQRFSFQGGNWALDIHSLKKAGSS